MTETTKKSVPQFRGLMFSINADFGTKELAYFMQRYEDQAKVAPTHLLVNDKTNISKIVLPEQYKTVEIQLKKWVLPKSVMVGVWL